MKVIYITVPSFFDLEISLIRELSHHCQIDVLMIVSPESQHSSAFSVEQLLTSERIIRASDYEEMMKYKNLIDLNKWYIANNPDNSLTSSIKLANQISDFIKKGNYDFLHCTTNCKTSFFLLPFIARFKHKILTVHDPIPHKKKSVYENIFRLKLYYRVFKNLLFLSDSLTDQFKTTYGNKKIYYSALGPYDFLTTFPKEECKYDNYILFFGRICQYKGVDILISAFNRSKYAQNGYKLIIAGKGKILNVEDKFFDNIIFLNRYIENQELANLIRNCDIVVLPYRSATQSGCVMSAYAFNKPILATSVGDLPQSVIDGMSGRIVAPNSEKDLINGLDYMYNSDLNKMSHWIQSNYTSDGIKSWKYIAKRLFDIYSQILEYK